MNTQDYIIRKIKINEIHILSTLFDYNDIQDMINENTRLMENEEIDIFALFHNDKLLGELHIKYKSEDINEAIYGKRAYLFAYRVHKDYQGKGIGKNLLTQTLNMLINQGYSEFTVGVEDDNECAKHIYKSFGFSKIIARKSETYQGDSYEYNLLLKYDVSF